MLIEEITKELLESLSNGYPLLCAENTFISCQIKDGKVIPMEGINQPVLEKVVTGQTGQKYSRSSGFLEKFQISYFLSMLRKQEATEEEYELESYPKYNMENRLHHVYCQTHPTIISTSEENAHKPCSNNIPSSIAFDSRCNEMENVDYINQPTDIDKYKMAENAHLRDRLMTYIEWLNCSEGKDYVFSESFSTVQEALTVLKYLKRIQKPSLVTLLARENEPVIMTFSSIHIGLDCVLFCLFQA